MLRRRTLAFAVSALVAFVAGNALHAAPITGNTAPGGFDRVDVPSDVALWLNAEAITGINDGQNVASWVNSATSSAASPAVQPTTARQPVYIENQLNGRPVVRFDGTVTAANRDRLDVTELSLGGSASAFVVALSTAQNTETNSGVRTLFL